VTEHSQLTLRPMLVSDLPRVLEIEAASFHTPWSGAMFEQELGNRLAWVRVAADARGTVIGYMVCRFYGDVWHVMDVAVDPESRRNGVGAALLDDFLTASSSTSADLTLEVRPGNSAALWLYQSRGFRPVGLRRRYYADTGEDAVIMVRPGAEHGPADPASARTVGANPKERGA
jgi:[ribosomal protein S18]-alanine N-acetyltransferase